MKVCGKCRVAQPPENFHVSTSRGTQAWCKTCRRDYDAAYHCATREIRAEQKRRRRWELSAFARELKDAPCVDCGGRFHPAAMHWDHQPGFEKRGEVGRLSNSLSRETILAEIAKCELVCANCHAVRTYNRMNGT